MSKYQIVYRCPYHGTPKCPQFYSCREPNLEIKNEREIAHTVYPDDGLFVDPIFGFRPCEHPFMRDGKYGVCLIKVNPDAPAIQNGIGWLFRDKEYVDRPDAEIMVGKRYRFTITEATT